MKTLYEELLKLPESSEVISNFKQELNEAEIIRIDNVAKYFFMSERDTWFIDRDFPNLAPPFEKFYMEYRIPEEMQNQFGTVYIPEGGQGWFGVLFIAKRYDNDVTGAYWSLLAQTFIAMKRDNFEPKFIDIQQYVGVDSRGCPVKLETHLEQIEICLYDEDKLDKSTVEKIIPHFRSFLYPGYLAISFMHCKNVSLIPKGPGTPGHPKRNRHGPTIRYHVLEIEPMKKVLRTEGRSEEVGLKRALHICRGHFKDFRDGKGLFGRYKDIYWWDSQVRGSIDEGIVLKDYNVHPKDD